MVKYTLTASLALIQLAMVAQTSFGLPVDSKDGLESRSISNRERLDQRDSTELDKRKPFGPLLAAAGLAALGGYVLHRHNKDKKEKEAAAQNQTPPPSTSKRRDLRDVGLDERDLHELEERYVEDLIKRHLNDYELEARDDIDHLD